MPDFALRGLKVAYSETGRGAPVLAIHGSAATGRLWAPLAEGLGPHRRTIAPDLFGYGASAPWEDARDCATDLDIVIELARAQRAPVHLVGHSYGGALALRAAVELGAHAASLALVEPAAFHILRLQRDPAWREIARVATRHVQLVEDGDLEACADVFMGYWIGAAAWAASSPTLRAKVVAAMPKVADEWRGIFVESHSLARYARLDLPALLVRGTRTTAAAARVVDHLAGALRDCTLAEIRDAGHMSPLTHGPAVAGAIAAHLGQVARPAIRVAEAA